VIAENRSSKVSGLYNIFLSWRKTPSEKYYLTFYEKGFSSLNRNYEIAPLLHMDHTIKELSSMTKIEGAEIKKPRLFQLKKELKTLDDLRAELEHENC
jgi:hypothetical protein